MRGYAAKRQKARTLRVSERNKQTATETETETCICKIQTHTHAHTDRERNALVERQTQLKCSSTQSLATERPKRAEL